MKKKILVVTPEEKKAQLIRRYLEQEGYECHYALNDKGTFKEIVKLKFQPDLMIIDSKLLKSKILSGLGFLKFIKEKRILDLNKVYIILLTEKRHPSGYIKVRRETFGIDEFLTKSMEVDVLIERVKRALK